MKRTATYLCICLFFLLSFESSIFAQSVGIGATQFVPSSTLEIKSNGNTSATYGFKISNSSGNPLLFIQDNGNVGIGTSAPAEAFSIYSNSNYLGFYDASGNMQGQLLATTGTTIRQFMFNFPATTGSGGSPDSWFALRFNGPSNKIFFGETGTNAWIQTDHDLYFRSNTSLTPGSALTPQMALTNAGNLGIGTSSPSAQLHTNGTVRFENYTNGILTVDATGNLGVGGGIYGWLITGNSATVPGTNFIGTLDAKDLVFKTGGSAATNERMRVLAAGNVGIGSTAPAQMLDVAGNIQNTLSSVNVPVQISSTTLPYMESAVVRGSYLYSVNNGGAGTFNVVDVSNPASPALVGSLAYGVNPRMVQVSGQYAYVSNSAGNALGIIDISNPSSPAVVSNYFFGGGNNVRKLAVQGKYAYVISHNFDILYIMDVSNPSAPVLLSSTGTLGDAMGVFPDGRYLYLINDSGSLQVFDVSDPTAPVIVGSMADADNPVTIYGSGRYIYIGDITTGNVRIVDVKNPASPAQVASVNVGSFIQVLTVSGKYLYVTGDKFSVLDITTPAAPVLLYQGPLNSFGAMFAAGRYVYIYDGVSNLLVYDTKGIETTALKTGMAEIGQLQVKNDITALGLIQSKSGFNAGEGGIFSSGGIGVTGLSTFNGGISMKRTATAASYTALITDYYIGITNTSAAGTITLPPAATAGNGKVYIIKDESGGAAGNNITVQGNGAELIDGANTALITTNYGSIKLMCNGTNWFTY